MNSTGSLQRVLPNLEHLELTGTHCDPRHYRMVPASSQSYLPRGFW